jgi:superfamily I DNA and RNA helicase
MSADQSLNVVFGDVRDREASNQLASALEQHVHQGTLFLGFPVISNADETLAIDALLIAESVGIVALLLNNTHPSMDVDWEPLIEEQNAAHLMLKTHLSRTASLRKGRDLAVTVNTLTVFPDDTHLESKEGALFVGITRVNEALEEFDSVAPTLEKALNSALQRVPGARNSKDRDKVDKPESKGWKLKEIGREITFMDKWQKAAAIETPAGPQRIRGLAGSGKTVVIAHKAAYLHTRNPESRIAVTFQTRSLYQQIESLVDSFVFDNWMDVRDPDKLEVLHAWGSFRDEGIYSRIAASIGFPVRSFNAAVQAFGYDDAFRGACKELLTEVQARKALPEPIFDVVLIDEAQDLPPEFFRLVYLFTSDPKRIIWAYDEFQKLSDEVMLGTKDLFGVDDSGQALVNIDNPQRGARRDIVLPTCYRNTPWALATAHALGLGIYAEGNLVNYPDSNQTWGDIGYAPAQGELTAGSVVTLERREDSTPEYFSRLISPADAVVFERFDTEAEQDSWIAGEIRKYLDNDEVRPDDCLIVLPVALVWKNRAIAIRKALDARGIHAHLVGVDNDVNEIHVRGSVAIAHIHRAKGNEAPIVFAVDSHLAAGQRSKKARRNALFTAITRSRGWVRITGHGPNSAVLKEEFDKIVDQNYRLVFTVPDADEVRKIRATPNDSRSKRNDAAARASSAARAMMELIKTHDLSIDQLDVDEETKELIRGLQED